jgi:hypothetical protein
MAAVVKAKETKSEPLTMNHELIVAIPVASKEASSGYVSTHVQCRIPDDLAAFLKRVTVACDIEGKQRPTQARGEKYVDGLADCVVYVLSQVKAAYDNDVQVVTR